jgi:hypothetical protein
MRQNLNTLFAFTPEVLKKVIDMGQKLPIIAQPD